jgi:hypothetical protein
MSARTGASSSNPVPGAASFSEGFAAVMLTNCVYYVDLQGRVAFGGRMDAGYGFSEGFARFKMGDRFGFIGRSGEFLVPPRFFYAEDFSEGLALVGANDPESGRFVFQYIDRTGRPVVDLGNLGEARTRSSTRCAGSPSCSSTTRR